VDAHRVKDPPDALSCVGSEEPCALPESANSGVAHRAAGGSRAVTAMQ
jgi:hypothetical protein